MRILQRTDSYWTTLCYTHILIQVLDWYVTTQGLLAGAREANPLIAYLIRTHGISPGLAIIKGPLIGLFAFLSLLQPERWRTYTALEWMLPIALIGPASWLLL